MVAMWISKSLSRHHRPQLAPATELFDDAALHLTGGLPGKGNRQNVAWRGAFFDEAYIAVDQDAGLAGTGRGFERHVEAGVRGLLASQAVFWQKVSIHDPLSFSCSLPEILFDLLSANPHVAACVAKEVLRRARSEASFGDIPVSVLEQCRCFLEILTRNGLPLPKAQVRCLNGSSPQVAARDT